MLHLCLFTRPNKRQAQQVLLSLLVHNKVFIPCWCTTRSFFPAGVQQGLLSLLGRVIIYKVPTLKFCHCKPEWPLVIKHNNWVDNHQMIITAKYGSHHFMCYGENLTQELLMSIHNVCFHVDIKEISITFGWKVHHLELWLINTYIFYPDKTWSDYVITGWSRPLITNICHTDSFLC